MKATGRVLQRHTTSYLHTSTLSMAVGNDHLIFADYYARIPVRSSVYRDHLPWYFNTKVDKHTTRPQVFAEGNCCRGVKKANPCEAYAALC